jgi:hypothetical protein
VGPLRARAAAALKALEFHTESSENRVRVGR